jgi:hypothetical protein
VIDQEIEHLLEDIPEHKDQTEKSNPHPSGNAEGCQKIAVEDFHGDRKRKPPTPNEQD